MSSLSQSADSLRILVTPSIPDSPALEDADDQTEIVKESIFQKKAEKTPFPTPPPNSPVHENKKVTFSLDDIVEQDKKIAEKIEEQEEKIIEKQSKPKRKRRPQTQKQKEALARGRAKALENRRKKAEMKKKEAEYRKLKREEDMREKENYIIKEKLKKEAVQREMKMKESSKKLDDEEIFKLFERYETYKKRKTPKTVEKSDNLPQKRAIISKTATRKVKTASLPKSMKKEKTVPDDPFSHFFN